MELHVTARHTELTPAISDYVRKKLSRIERHSSDIIWTQVILSVEKRRHIAEIVMHMPGNTYRTQGESDDLYAAIDLVIDKLDKLIRRQKDRKTTRRETKKVTRIIKTQGKVQSEFLEQASPQLEPYNNGLKEVVESLQLLIETRSVASALEKIKDLNLPVFPFIDDETQQISILYRKGQKKFGLLKIEE